MSINENLTMTVFKLDDENCGVINYYKQKYHNHFEFDVLNCQESVIFSVYYNGEVVDYEMYSVDNLPIGSEIDEITIPMTFSKHVEGSMVA